MREYSITVLFYICFLRGSTADIDSIREKKSNEAICQENYADCRSTMVLSYGL